MSNLFLSLLFASLLASPALYAAKKKKCEDLYKGEIWAKIVEGESDAFIDEETGDAVAVATVLVKRPYEEVVALVEPSNWHKYGGSFEVSKLDKAHAVGSEYTANLHEIFNESNLFGGARIENILKIEAKNYDDGRIVDYSLVESISVYTRVGLLSRSQEGGMIKNEGWTEIVKGEDGVHTVQVVKRLQFNVFFPWAPLWTPSFQNATAAGGFSLMPEKLNENLLRPL